MKREDARHPTQAKKETVCLLTRSTESRWQRSAAIAVAWSLSSSVGGRHPVKAFREPLSFGDQLVRLVAFLFRVAVMLNASSQETDRRFSAVAT